MGATEYKRKLGSSSGLFERALRVLPDGLTHTCADVDLTVQAWDATVRGMKNEGLLKARL